MQRWPAREVILLARNLVSVIGIIALLFAMAPGPRADADAIFWPATRPASVQWSTALQQQFPDCRPRLVGQLPASVVEVRSGMPLRVGFADAWRRTHDEDPGNNGQIIAVCTRVR